jgi:hypothetical protein
MAIHTQASRTNDRWAVFARNGGNEGSCGSAQVPVPMQSFSMRLGHPFATSVRFNDSSFVGRAGRYDLNNIVILSAPTVGWNLSSTVVHAGTPEAAAVLTITLPPPEARAVVLGEFGLTWTESLARFGDVTKRRRISDVAARRTPQATTSSRDDDDVEELVKRMTPVQRRVFLANTTRSKSPTALTPVQIPQSPNLRPVKVQDVEKLSRVTPDSIREQEMQQFYRAICTAYRGRVPGVPNACRTRS